MSQPPSTDDEPVSPDSTLDSEPPILQQLMEALRDLRQQGRTVAIRICPQCHSPALRSSETHYDIGGAMGITPPKYRCPRCGYWSRIIIEATNEDIDEALLDDLLRADQAAAQTLLKEAQEKIDKEEVS